MLRTLVNLTPANEFRAVEEMLGQLFGNSCNESTPAAATLAVDITEHENTLLIRSAVPGIAPEDLEITVENGVLTIRGETKAESSGENERIYRREISYGAFSRSIRLGENLNIEQVEATFKNGVVTIKIPRVIEAKPEPRRIPITTVSDHLGTESTN